jgi:DNA-binding CsgD family transcriptional regulator
VADESERTRRLKLLLASLDDWVPGPRSSRSLQAAPAGEAPSRRIDCPRCRGSGEQHTRRGLAACPECEGTGRIVVDAYTARRVLNGNGLPLPAAVRRALEAERADYDSKAARRRRVDRVLAEIEREQLHRAGLVAADELEPWERAKRALHAQGDYAALERELATLRRRDQAAFVALWRTYGPERGWRVIGPRMQQRADAALRELERAMPDPIRVPESLLRAKTRDEEILRLTRLNCSQEEIGRRLGCSAATVSRALQRQLRRRRLNVAAEAHSLATGVWQSEPDRTRDGLAWGEE